MSNQNKKKNSLVALTIIAGLILPIFLPAFIMMALDKWMPDEISFTRTISLFILSIELFVIAGIFTKILSLIGLTEKKIDELGFLGTIISVISSFLSIIVGYYWMKTLHLTSVQLSSNGILIIAIVSTVILVVLLKALDKLE
ncbi:epimerase [Solibacillus cecembensis]|uniref:epimerase n=1 Tax=Solibacillus cecembensis TaxID=459347 RepID=UPI003CFCE493